MTDTLLQILIADDNAVDRKILARILRNQGNTVIEATDGSEAVGLFIEHRPDMVLMDVMMPVMDGQEAARLMKQEAGEDFVPIIFLTSLTDVQGLADCLESGGDDFLTKPYSPVVLQAKVRAFYRMREMHRTLQEQRDTIARHNEHLVYEQEAAKAVFDNVAHHGCLSAQNIRYMLSPLALFNGDVVLAGRGPSGTMQLLLGDFTGHGLPAAIGAMPLAEVFYGMTQKGFGLSDIAREINLKMHAVLPVGYFCCAALVEMNFDTKSVSIWMGGVPDGYLLRKSGDLVSLRSRHLPLGVLSNQSFDESVERFDLANDDRLLLWTDGITEVENRRGTMFGDDRLRQTIEKAETPAVAFDDILAAVDAFKDSHRVGGDDKTLLEMRMVDRDLLDDVSVQVASGPTSGPIDWSMNYRLGPESLRHFNPLPLMVHILMEVPGLRSISGQLYTVMAELFSNAFEHGVLKISSGLKHSSQGFLKYYQEREQRIRQLTDGYVNIAMEHKGNGSSGDLTIIVEDSGDGFDVARHVNPGCVASASTYSGRGIILVREICDSLEYQQGGSRVIAKLHWTEQKHGEKTHAG